MGKVAGICEREEEFVLVLLHISEDGAGCIPPRLRSQRDFVLFLVINSHEHVLHASLQRISYGTEHTSGSVLRRRFARRIDNITIFEEIEHLKDSLAWNYKSYHGELSKFKV